MPNQPPPSPPTSRKQSEAIARESQRWLTSTVNGVFREDIAVGSETAAANVGEMIECDGFTEMLVVYEPRAGVGGTHQYDIYFQGGLPIEERVNPEKTQLPENLEKIITINRETRLAETGQFIQQFNIAGYRYIWTFVKNFTGDPGSILDLIVVLMP